VAPVYISEIAPAKYRGRLVISFQLNVVSGILLAYLCNYIFQRYGGIDGWRWMLGIVAVPSILFSVFMWYVPETPRWLLLFKNDEAHAREVLSLTEDDIDRKIEEIKTSVSKKREPLFNKKFYKPLLLAFLLASFNQFSGINAIIYFAPRVFEMAGLAKDSAFLGTAGIGIVNLLFTILGWYLIDRYGRRTLMFIGSVGYIISLALIAWSFHTNQTQFITYYVFLFIASHAVGQGAVIWVFISEIFPNSVRAAGTSFGCLTHWFWAAMVAQVFPFVASSPSIGPVKIFGFFAVMMVLQLLFVWKMMPETKGISLEKMDRSIGH
jgi:sugar porter (SP) family MFS transporter